VKKNNNKPKFSPTLCLTHNCNLNCLYCYQSHDSKSKMSLQTAKKIIDWLFDNRPPNMRGIEIGFIGGEPLLEFELIKEIVSYTKSKPINEEYVFYATTNGTVLTKDMKKWFIENKEDFILGLSLDGAKETHDYNRSNSFDQIDFDFFVQNWPYQPVKMTLSEYSIPRLAENIKYIHSLGFKEIGGVNLFEGNFDWSSEKYIDILINQLAELVEFYVQNDELALDQMLNKHLDMCETKKHKKQKWCGIGDGAICFDVDGKKYPCPLMTPMTFGKTELSVIETTDFSNVNAFVDPDCYENCYIYPICPNCPGANYLNNKSFKIRDKSKCRIQKLVSIFSADLHAKRIVKNHTKYSNSKLYHTINAIKKIRELLLPEFKEHFI